MLIEILGRLLTKFLAPRPVQRKEGHRLIIRSGWRTTLFTLGGRSRKVTVDPQVRAVRVQDRSFWFITWSKFIAFDRILEVIYSYSDLVDSNWISHDTQDLYVVGLFLTDGKRIKLFRYYGQGEFVNNSIWPDWMMWDEFLAGEAVKHDMESEALAVAETLAKIIGVPLGNGEILPEFSVRERILNPRPDILSTCHSHSFALCF